MEKEKVDKKDHILDVAEKVFADLGFEGASTRLISGEAGVNMAMLNYYFGSKEGLFVAIFERKIASFQTLLQNIGDDDSISAWDKIQQCVDSYIERIIVNNCFQKLMNRELSMTKRSDLTDRITQILMVNVLEFKKIFEEGINAGIFYRDIDVEMAIATIFGTKNFIINTPHVSSIMLGHDVSDDKFLEDKLKPRIRAYMTRLLESYLLIEHDN